MYTKLRHEQLCKQISSSTTTTDKDGKEEEEAKEKINDENETTKVTYSMLINFLLYI